MKLSVFVNEGKRVAGAVEAVVDAERRGFHGAWTPQIMGFDAMSALTLAAARTERILLGTSVVPTWPRHPFVMAQQALTVSQVADGRFRLGVGTSHVPVIRDMLGLEFDRPIGHIREYLHVVKSLTTEGSVGFEGDHYRVHGAVEIPDARMPVMISVLSEQMTRTAGRHADGAVTWLAPPSYIRSTVAPLVREAAAEAGREPPPVVCQVPAAASGDAAGVRKVVKRLFGVYPMLPFYNTMMQKAGLPDAEAARESGWSDDLVDAVIVYGDDAAIGERVAEYHDAGADEVVLAPFPVGGDWSGSLGHTLDVLEAVARA